MPVVFPQKAAAKETKDGSSCVILFPSQRQQASSTFPAPICKDWVAAQRLKTKSSSPTVGNDVAKRRKFSSFCRGVLHLPCRVVPWPEVIRLLRGEAVVPALDRRGMEREPLEPS